MNDKMYNLLAIYLVLHSIRIDIMVHSLCLLASLVSTIGRVSQLANGCLQVRFLALSLVVEYW